MVSTSETQATLATTKVLDQTPTEVKDRTSPCIKTKADHRLVTMSTTRTTTERKSSHRKLSLSLKKCSNHLTKKSLLLLRKSCSPNFLRKLSATSLSPLRWEVRWSHAIQKRNLLASLSKWWATSTNWDLVASSKFSSTNLTFLAWKCSTLILCSKLSGSSELRLKKLLAKMQSQANRSTFLTRLKKMWDLTPTSEVESTPSWLASLLKLLFSWTISFRTLTTLSPKAWSTSLSNKLSEKPTWSRLEKYRASLISRIRSSFSSRSWRSFQVSRLQLSRVSSAALLWWTQFSSLCPQKVVSKDFLK